MAKRIRNTEKVRVEQIQDPAEFERLKAASAEYRSLTARLNELLGDFDWKLRFFGLLDIKGPDDCWEWQGHRQLKTGHGRFQTSVFEKSGTHQIAYLLLRGPIAPGLAVCHSCDNPPCCNPNHLWLGTQAENQRDSWLKGRRSWPPGHFSKIVHARGEASGQSKLTETQVREIIASPLSNCAVARLYPVNDRSVSAIRAGKTWRHVPRKSKERDQ